MFHLQYRPKIAALHVKWYDFGQSFVCVQEADVNAMRRRYRDYDFRLLYR